MRETVVRIVNCDREAGYGSQPKPPNTLIGKRVMVGRPLIGYSGYWVEYKGKKYVLLACEINKCSYYEKDGLTHTDRMSITGNCGPECPLLSSTEIKGKKRGDKK